jgi:hypothetical protein
MGQINKPRLIRRARVALPQVDSIRIEFSDYAGSLRLTIFRLTAWKDGKASWADFYDDEGFAKAIEIVKEKMGIAKKAA